MESKNLIWIIIITLLFPTAVLVNVGTASSTPTIYVDPPTSAKEVTLIGQEFSVKISVADVPFLYAWQFRLRWDPNLLNATGFAEGPFLKDVGETRPRNTIYNDLGFIEAFNTLLNVDDDQAPSGEGTLAVITFLVKAEGECSLNITDEMLVNRMDPLKPGQSVAIEPHETENGYFKFPLPILHVDPPNVLNSSLTSGLNFTIDINVATVTNLASWQFVLEWNPDLLNATNVKEGPFLSQNGIHETTFLPPVINQTGGYVLANCTLENPDNAVSGNGTIAKITFLVEDIGDTSLFLPLEKTKLVDNEDAIIHHATSHGYFSNVLRDIAILNVEASPTEVKAGDPVTIEVTVKNEGKAKETSIDVSVKTPSPPSPAHNLIGAEVIPSLDVGQETTLNFTWNTKEADKGEYTIMAEATIVPGETDTDDNVGYADDTVRVTAPGELPTTLIVAVVIVVVVVGIVIYLYVRRRSPKA